MRIADVRAEVFETVGIHGGTGQTFVFHNPARSGLGGPLPDAQGRTSIRGEGETAINLPRLVHADVVTSRLGGEPPCIDTPPLWVRHLRNVGQGELVTKFWTDQLFSSDDPDQHPEEVVTS